MNPPVVIIPSAQRPTVEACMPLVEFLAHKLYHLTQHGDRVTLRIERRMANHAAEQHALTIECVRPVLVTTSDTIRASFEAIP